VNPPVAPDVPHVEDGANEVADQSPPSPADPGVCGEVVVKAEIAPSLSGSTACRSLSEPLDFVDFGDADVDELGDAD
jgi:hypothetical protein